MQGFTRGYWGYRGLQGVIGTYRGLQGVTGGYKGLQRVTRGYRRLQGVTGGYSGLQGVTRGSRQARSQDFFGGGAIKRGDGPNEAWGEVGLSATAFQAF